MKYVISSPASRIDGTIVLQGAKNSMLNNLCVPLLTDEECIISNVPLISDILTNLDILISFGASVNWVDQHTVAITCGGLTNKAVNFEKSVLTTGSKLFIPMMVARFGEYRTGASGGDRIGDRQFVQYAQSLEHFGIAFRQIGESDFLFSKSDRMTSLYRLPFPSFGLTVNAILAASATNLEVTLENTCLEPEIDNTIEMINKMGGNIKRVGDASIKIDQHSKLSGCVFRNMSDRNAAVTYVTMALAAHGRLIIENYDDVKMSAFYKFLEMIGAKYDRSQNRLSIPKQSGPWHTAKISAFLYPEFHSDWQPIVGPLLTQADGKSYIEERLFPNRLEHWHELGAMGAEYQYRHGPLDRFQDDHVHAVFVNGPVVLKPATVVAKNLRAGAAFVVAALLANGETEIDNADEIERGYEDMPGTLRSVGVDIRVQP